MSNPEEQFQKKRRKLGSFAEECMGNDDVDINELIDRSEFNDSYISGDKIAEGGLKIVRKVRDRKTGREVAMALLKDEYRSPSNIERFLREARILASLEHNNIVPIYDINYDKKDNLFFTMKLLSGETLAQILKKLKSGDPDYQKRYSLNTLLGIFMRVCDAVSYAHSKKIVHLDLKPENIQISEFGEVSVIDWGMAKNLSDEDELFYTDTDLLLFTPVTSNLTQAGSISGTPAYMSPEQAGRENVAIGKASDIYSLGATLFSIICTNQPYPDHSTDDIIRKTKDGIMPDFPAKVKGKPIAPALKAITVKAMNPEPDQRYESVQELNRDIFLFSNDFTTQAEDINLISFGKLFIKRHHNKILAVMIVTLLICSTIYLSLKEIREKEAILKQQDIKINATSEEIIGGAMEKHKKLRDEYRFEEIIANYNKLEKLGYNYHEFWYDKAKLYAGELNFEEALSCLAKVSGFEDEHPDKAAFEKLHKYLLQMQSITETRTPTNDEYMHFAVNTDLDIQLHIFRNILNNSSMSIHRKMIQLRENLAFYNSHIPESEFKYKHEIHDNYIKVDLSEVPDLKLTSPLLGAPINELNLSNTQVNISPLASHIKEFVTVLIINGNKNRFNDFYIRDSKIEKLVARNCNYEALNFAHAPTLKHLDIQGSIIGTGGGRSPSPSINYLNIAFTNFEEFELLSEFNNLKTLVIDDSMVLPQNLLKKLKKSGTYILVKEKPSVEAVVLLIEDKEYKLRNERKYEELLNEYVKLENSGYDNPELWYRMAGLFAGEFRLGKAYEYLNRINAGDSSFKEKDDYQKFFFMTESFYNRNQRGMDEETTLRYMINMHKDVQDHIFWNMNTDPDKSLSEKTAWLEKVIRYYNKVKPSDNLNYKHTISDKGNILDISNNPEMRYGGSVLGYPLTELNISNTNINIHRVRNYLKNNLKVLNLSNTPNQITNNIISHSAIEKLTARGCTFPAFRLDKAKNLRYLDIQGADILHPLKESSSLEHLNIAFSNFDDYDLLLEFKNLRKLIIDQSMRITDPVLTKLKERGIEIITKK